MRKSFSLIELMVAASILSVGIVLILRSFLTVISALDLTSNRIGAMQFLEIKMNELEQKAREEGGIDPGESREEVVFGSRPGVWKLEAAPLEIDAPPGQEDVYEVKMTLLWQEGNKDKDEILATYFAAKETE